MSLETRKIALIQRITTLEKDEVAMVEQLLEILEEAQFASFPPMSPRTLEEIKTDYEQSIKELEDGQGIPHEVVVAYFKQRYRIS